MGRMVYLRNVVTLALEEEKCLGCGTCLLVCPRAVLVRSDGKVRIADRDSCMECGACATNCPAEAIHVEAGVGCAAAVINAALGRQNSSCCCVADAKTESGPEAKKGGSPKCC